MPVQEFIEREFDAINHHQSWYSDANGKFFPAHKMFTYIKQNNIKKEKLYLNSIRYSRRRDNVTPIEMVELIHRIKNSKMKYPIVIHYDWTIVDWYHRLTKALIKKKKFIRAYRIDIYKI